MELKIYAMKIFVNCEAIANSSHIDVLEMDAASKTGVDDVRDLIEFSRYGPSSSKFKIFIIDEVHMLSKQAFNALLKTLEEPPEYLKFIFATTEIKKIPITVVSRCQRFDLSRIKSTDLLDYLKKIKVKENGKVTEEALKLIVKISEGSVRDALSLLDRAIISQVDEKELDLKNAQKIFGYFDKSQLIDLFEYVLQGNEEKVVNIYRKIYDQGIEPKVFINDFLEILYYFKNINSLTLESTNFSLNDEEFIRIKKIANYMDNKTMLLFWQFTIKTLNELDIVSNQHLSIEMFLIRLIHLVDFKFKNNNEDKKFEISLENKIEDNIVPNVSLNDTINQIKNVSQEKKSKPESVLQKKVDKFSIDSFNDLLNVCSTQKEIKLKYELENNINLVKFEIGRIEISFNDNLDKDFVKDLSSRLFEWTDIRWIISFSKLKGEMTVKEKELHNKLQLINDTKKSSSYKKMLEFFPDAELIDVKNNKKKKD